MFDKRVTIYYTFGDDGDDFEYDTYINENTVKAYLCERGGKRFRDEMGVVKSTCYNATLSSSDVATVMDVFECFGMEEILVDYIAEDEDFLNEYYRSDAYDEYRGRSSSASSVGGYDE